MPDLNELLQRTKTVVVDYHGEKINVTFRPSKINAEWEQNFNEWLKGEWKSKAVVETLASALVSWDLTDKGKPYPTSTTALVKLPLDLLTAIFAALMETQRPNPKSPGSFAAG